MPKPRKSTLSSLLTKHQNKKTTSLKDYINNNLSHLENAIKEPTEEELGYELRLTRQGERVAERAGPGRAHNGAPVASAVTEASGNRVSLTSGASVSSGNRDSVFSGVSGTTATTADAVPSENDLDRISHSSSRIPRSPKQTPNPTKRPIALTPRSARQSKRTTFHPLTDPTDSNYDSYAISIVQRWNWPPPSLLDNSARTRVQTEIDFVLEASNLTGSIEGAQVKLSNLEDEIRSAGERKQWARLTRAEANMRVVKGNVQGYEGQKRELEGRYRRSYEEEGTWAGLVRGNLWEMKKVAWKEQMRMEQEWTEGEEWLVESGGSERGEGGRGVDDAGVVGESRLRGIKRGRTKDSVFIEKKRKIVMGGVNDLGMESDESESEQDLNELLRAEDAKRRKTLGKTAPGKSTKVIGRRNAHRPQTIVAQDEGEVGDAEVEVDLEAELAESRKRQRMSKVVFDEDDD